MVEPGVVCDVMGTAEPVCAVVAEPAHDPTGLVELHPHADPDTWLLENPGWLSGGAYRWFRDELGGQEAARAKASGADVYELLNALAQCAPPGAGGVTWLPALAGAMAPEWNANARAAWYGMTAAHGRAHLARALLEGNALALRDVIEAIAGAGHAPSELVCVGGGAKGHLLLELRAHITGLPVSRPEDVETTARGAAMLAAAGAGLHPTVADAARAMAGARHEPVRPDAELREVYDELHRRHLALYEALRPLFNRRRGVVKSLDGALEASRRRAIEAATSGDLDVLVVGGGITGAGAALDAATRGLRVALVEARDLAAGTSSASSKLIHGGLRYLEMGDLALVREALRERELLLTRLAPHLVAPVPFLWPLRGRGWERAYLGAGLILYDTIGGARSVPRHRHLSRSGALALAPALRPDALVGAVQFHDAAEDDARMVVAVARTAAAHGAHIATRVRVTGFRGPGEVEAVDEETGEPLLLRARHVAGAAGVWTDRLRELAGGTSSHRIVPSKGIHIFVARDRLPMATGVLARTEKSVLFVIPWQGGWLIGDTDTPWRHGPDSPVATGADVDYLLAKTNALMAQPLSRDDVHGVTVGLRPLVADAARSDTTRISRKHVVESPAPGLTTIAGGKYTTYRVMAADLIDAVAPGTRSVTRDVPLLGAERAAELAALIDAQPELAEPLEGGHIKAEVVHACNHEGALHVEDVLERRTRLALTAPDRGLAAAEPAAALMADVLGWSPDQTRREVDGYRARVAAARAAEAERDDDAALAAYRATLAERRAVRA